MDGNGFEWMGYGRMESNEDVKTRMQTPGSNMKQCLGPFHLQSIDIQAEQPTPRV